MIWAVRGGAADADGDEDLARRLYAETKLRLICVSDEELWELAKLFSSSKNLVELVYEETKRVIEEHMTTASECVNDLVRRPQGGEG